MYRRTRRSIQLPALITVQRATLIPTGMHGMAQFRGKASGYLQVAPAYERPLYGLGQDDSDYSWGDVSSDQPDISEDSGQPASLEYGYTDPMQGMNGLGAWTTEAQFSTIRTLVGRGVHPVRARQLVASAARKYAHLRTNARLPIRTGFGDVGLVPPAVLVQATAIQTQHQQLIDQFAGTTDPAVQTTVRANLEKLWNDWTNYAITTEGNTLPDDWVASDSTVKILTEVRNDIRATTDAIDTHNLSLLKTKVVSESWIPPAQGGTPPPPPAPAIPWWAWAGGSVVALGALAGGKKR